MLNRLQGVLLRDGIRQACRAASIVNTESFTCRIQMSTDVAAAAQVDRLAADADAAAPDTASRQPVNQHSGAADSEDQHDSSARPQAPDPLEMFRQSNVSMPRLEGQVVKARIVAVDQKTVTLDSGYKYTSTLFKREMSGVPIYNEEGHELGVPEEYRVGDILHVRIDALETPFGDMQLNLGVRMSVHEQTDVILARLRRAMDSKTPVMGRILNAVNKGYSVGIAGLVCFLPITQCMYQTAARVGVLQPFYVQNVREDIRNVVLSDAAKETLTAPSGIYSRPGTIQATPFQPRLRRRLAEAPPSMRNLAAEAAEQQG